MTALCPTYRQTQSLNDVVTQLLVPPLGLLFQNVGSFWDWLRGNLGWNNLLDLQTVWNDINWNRCQKETWTVCSVDKAGDWKSSVYLSKEQLNVIVNTYHALTLRSKNPLPEFDPNNNSATAVIVATAHASGQTQAVVTEVLQTMYYSWTAGRLTGDFLIRPATAREYGGVRTDRQPELNTPPSGGIFDGVADTVKWVAIGLGALGAIYLVSKL